MPTQVDNPAGTQDPREDLAQIILAYNSVTEKLQQSHEKLKGEVLRLREELASTNAQLQRSKRLSALGEMAAGIAHEIRNPLAAIQLYAGMIVQDLEAIAAPAAACGLAQSPDDAQPSPADTALTSARKIASAVRGLNGIVVDVLSFAREIHPQPQQVTAGELFRGVLEAHRPAIDAANVTVQQQGELTFEFAADAALLQQALLNLVRNAVDAMADQPQRILTLTASPAEGNCVSLTVRDTGPGIDTDDIDRIFNPFFTTRNTGTGLGLAIVHRIVDAHDGTIVVDNNNGATFEITLPVTARAAGKQADASPLASGSESAV